MGNTKSDALVLAGGTDPGVTPTWDGLPPGIRGFIVDIVGSAMNVGIVFAVLVVVVGAIGWGISTWTNRPGIAGKFVVGIGAGAVVAMLCAGANALITWFAGIGVSIFS